MGIMIEQRFDQTGAIRLAFGAVVKESEFGRDRQCALV